MVEILSLTNNLSQSLQKGDQDIVHAMELVQICKKKLQEFNDGGWETLYEQVMASSGNVEIDVPDMESRTLVRTKKHKTFRFVYTPVKLALFLPVVSASVERVFSGMKCVKDELRSRMANPWLNDCLVAFVKKVVFNTIDDMDIIKRFQGMNKRRMHLRLD
ncbi:uncharacterized protein LOC131640073 [Vicia villosa]|uniref:uncharacterized protein LOC131640073 n=1 Tax=Vicia villosa TaxID=3911 RepID=UPI00273A8BDB|nr:uncharacterized protein LOC131640073 [Vicia villosa]